jgi:HPt (histidine-containing phosphotransfer) domain-containing protein
LLHGLLAEIPPSVLAGVVPMIDAGIAQLADRLREVSDAGMEPAARAAHALAGAASTIGLRRTAVQARETEAALLRGETARATALAGELQRDHPAAVEAFRGFLARRAA